MFARNPFARHLIARLPFARPSALPSQPADTTRPALSRRGLLGGTGVVAASLAVPAAASSDPVQPTGPAGRHDPQMADSDHIRTYYALARS